MSDGRLVVAAAQMTSRADVPDNLARAASLVRRAAERGARLVVLPENFAFFASDEAARLVHAETLDAARPGPILAALLDAARATGAWVVGGGMPERADDAGGREGAVRSYNTCVVVSPDGRLAGSYRKIHLFDVRTADGVEYRESRSVAPGGAPVVVETPWGGLGLSVCYDVRFPELYRRLVALGARLVVVPAAFTLQTGKDHWHLLVRARAVENQVFVIAAAQQGRHDERRVTYGHSLVVDPWGTALADAPDGEGLALAELDFARQDAIRRDLPCLDHRRL